MGNKPIDNNTSYLFCVFVLYNKHTYNELMITLPNRRLSDHLRVRKEQWYPEDPLTPVLPVTLSSDMGADIKSYRRGAFLVAEDRPSCCAPGTLSHYLELFPGILPDVHICLSD